MRRAQYLAALAVLSALAVAAHGALAADPAPATSASAAGSARPAPGPIDPNAPLPAGHPQMGASPPPGDDSANDDEETPPAGHDTGEPQVQDRVMRAPELRPGSIEVYLHDGSEQPLPNYPVRLGIMKQDVAEGDTRSQKDAKTDDKGVVLFTGLEIGTAFSYRVTAQKDTGTFASEPVRLDPNGGQRVLLHVFPVTRDLRVAMVGLRAILFVGPREDVFQIEGNFQILNIGKQAWVPEHITLDLPPGAKAFRASDTMKDTRFEKVGAEKPELLGTFAPGEHEVGFSFQLPNDHTRSLDFKLALLPNVADVRVIAERARGMSLRVDGFPESEPVESRDGTALLLTQKHLVRGDTPFASVSIGLDNLPVPPLGRWYALGLASAIAVGGLFEAARRRQSAAPLAVPTEEREEAERLVLDELVTLERLHQQGSIGPQTYKETRIDLLDALGRLTPR